MRLRGLFEHSGWKVLRDSFLTFVAANLVIWVTAWDLPAPWGGVLTGFAAFVAGALRTLVSNAMEPTVDARTLPLHMVEDMTIPDREKVMVARAKQTDKELS